MIKPVTLGHILLRMILLFYCGGSRLGLKGKQAGLETGVEMQQAHTCIGGPPPWLTCESRI